MALYGCFFTNRKVASMDFGAAMRTILADGIISGMALTKSGATLNVAKGYMIACGRVIGNDAALALTMTQTSGYARVVIKIDLTETATESTFSQLSTRIDYASTEDGFSALVQDDINDGTHTTYEVALCILKLTSSGIDSAPQKLPDAMPKIGNRAITAEMIALLSITAELLANGSVNTDKLAWRCVTGNRIALYSTLYESGDQAGQQAGIEGRNINSKTITERCLDDASVTTRIIAPGNVTAAMLGSDIKPANVGIKHGTATPTTTTCPSGCIYLKHS